MTKNYYRGAVGGLLVYDITSRETYNQLQHWLTDARTLAVDNCAIVVVGNKADLKDQREVTNPRDFCMRLLRTLGLACSLAVSSFLLADLLWPTGYTCRSVSLCSRK